MKNNNKVRVVPAPKKKATGDRLPLLRSISPAQPRLSKSFSPTQLPDINQSAEVRRPSKLGELSAIYGSRSSKLLQPITTGSSKNIQLLPRTSRVILLPPQIRRTSQISPPKRMSMLITNELRALCNPLLVPPFKVTQQQLLILDVECLGVRRSAFFGFEERDVDEQLLERFNRLYEPIALNENNCFYLAKSYANALKQLNSLYNVALLVTRGDRLQELVRQRIESKFKVVLEVEDRRQILTDFTLLRYQRILLIMAAPVNHEWRWFPCWQHRTVMVEQQQYEELHRRMLRALNSPQFDQVLLVPQSQLFSLQHLEQLVLGTLPKNRLNLEEWLKQLKEKRDAVYVRDMELHAKRKQFEPSAKIKPFTDTAKYLTTIGCDQLLVRSLVERNQNTFDCINRYVRRIARTPVAAPTVTYADLEFVFQQHYILG